MSVKMGLLEENKMPEAYREKFCQNRVLSPEEVEAAMKEAKARGLPDGWTVEYNNKHRGKLWISPDGKKCTSLDIMELMKTKLWTIFSPDTLRKDKPHQATRLVRNSL